MSCRSCASGNQAEFSTEMMLHFSGVKNLDRAGVMIFPKVLVCLECGFSQFTAPKTELTLLANASLGVKSFAQSNR